MYLDRLVAGHGEADEIAQRRGEIAKDEVDGEHSANNVRQLQRPRRVRRRTRRGRVLTCSRLRFVFSSSDAIAASVCSECFA